MYEMLVRAELHRVALGDTAAGDAVRLFAGRIDNPAVIGRVASLESPAHTRAANETGLVAH